MHPTHICENTDLICIHAGKYEFVLCMGCLFVALIGIPVNNTHIAEAVHKEADFCLFHFLLFVYSFLCVLNNGASLCAILFFDSIQFLDDHIAHGIIVVQNIFIRSNVLHGLIILRLKRFNLQSDKTVQTHLQNGSCLVLCKFQILRSLLACLGLEFDSLCDALHQAFLYLLPVLASTKDFDDQVDHIAGLD